MPASRKPHPATKILASDSLSDELGFALWGCFIFDV
jgi:hypothetical protein